MKQKSVSIAVLSKDAEKVRQDLSGKKILRQDLKIARDKTYIYFPVIEIPQGLGPYKIVEKDFEKHKREPSSYKDRVCLPESEKEHLPTSYDIIGDMLLIKLPKELVKYKKRIGESLLESHHNIRTVCLSLPVTGELRTRQIEVIAGRHRTITTHTEYGLFFDVDVQTMYFSPRLASERKRVAGLVHPGEIIVDMFAGVAPFSIMIARFAKPKIVYAIDKNEKAVQFALKNVKRNHVLEKIEVIHADAQETSRVVPEKADRIIMNLPFSAYEFFAAALQTAKKSCVIHYYDILKEDAFEQRITHLKTIAKEYDYDLLGLQIRRIKTYAPREFYIGIDITATKHADVA